MNWTENRFTVWELNPNDVGAFLVLLFLSFLPLLTFKRWWVSVPILGIQGILLFLVVGTGSRGAVVALLVALVIGCWYYFNRIKLGPSVWIMTASVLLMAIVAVGCGLKVFSKSQRLGEVNLAADASAGRRLQVWFTAPTMMVAAPGGWGSDRAGEAYKQWFQPMEEPVHLKHMLSSHISWLVEIPWYSRLAYLLLWCLALVFMMPHRHSNLSVWGLGVCFAFGVTLLFNATGKWWNWIIPLLWLSGVLAWRLKKADLPSTSLLKGAIIVAFLLFVAPYGISLFQDREPIRASHGGNVIRFGMAGQELVVVGPNPDVLGDFYAHHIRRNFAGGEAHSRTVVVVYKPAVYVPKLIKEASIILVAGQNEAEFREWLPLFKGLEKKRLYLLNCRIPPGDWINRFSEVIYLRGQFYGDPYAGSWQLRSKDTGVSGRVINGQERYVTSWLESLPGFGISGLDANDGRNGR